MPTTNRRSPGTLVLLLRIALATLAGVSPALLCGCRATIVAQPGPGSAPSPLAPAGGAPLPPGAPSPLAPTGGAPLPPGAPSPLAPAGGAPLPPGAPSPIANLAPSPLPTGLASPMGRPSPSGSASPVTSDTASPVTSGTAGLTRPLPSPLPPAGLELEVEAAERIPAPGRQEPPPAGPRVRPPRPPTGAPAALVAELASRYGIKLRGNYQPDDVQRAMNVARLFRPEETRGLTIDYVPSGSGSGLLGRWSSTGLLSMFARGEDTLAHETGHHITLYSGNARTVRLGRELFAKATGGTGNLQSIPASLAPTRFARKNSSEYCAETLMAVAATRQRIRMEDDRLAPGFRPAPIEPITRQIFAEGN